MATPTLLPSIFKCGYQRKYSESVFGSFCPATVERDEGPESGFSAV